MKVCSYGTSSQMSEHLVKFKHYKRGIAGNSLFIIIIWKVPDRKLVTLISSGTRTQLWGHTVKIKHHKKGINGNSLLIIITWKAPDRNLVALIFSGTRIQAPGHRESNILVVIVSKINLLTTVPP